ncbi:MAG: recombinase family protein [Candidatus Cryosericum sp.]
MKYMSKYVAYYRVSTPRQGTSGLGLEAQQRDVTALIRRNGGELVAEYVEVETGKMAARPKLLLAIHHAQLSNATLVVAKLDRLARNALFTMTLQESGLPFVCCDNEHATPLTIGFLALVAEHEAEQIATRTRAALASAKARGTRLGSHRPGFWDSPERAAARRRGSEKGLPVARAAYAEEARKHYCAYLMPEIQRRRAVGETLQQIVDWLNAQGFTTRKRHCAFTVGTVQRLIRTYLGKDYLGHPHQVLENVHG